MPQFKTFGIISALLVLAAGGCTTGQQLTMPPPGGSPAPSSVVYVSSFNSPAMLAIISLPVTASSTPTYITPTGLADPAELRFDKLLNLWAANDSVTSPAGVGYNRPLTNASSPFASVNIPTPSAPDAIAFDASGNLWVADGNLGKVYEFTGPFSGTTTPTPAVTLTGLNGPAGLAFDAAGNLYVANLGTSSVLIFNPPFTNGEAPTGSPITGLTEPDGIAFDASANLYIANFGGSIARKNAPTAGGGAAEITDTAKTMLSPSDIALDASGNLYATDLQQSKLFVFPTATAAFSATLAPSVTLTLTGFGAAHASGVAVGPP